MLLVSERGPIPAAATFTRNRMRAAPVELAMRSLRASRGHAAAVIANAGCANAGTGAQGLADAKEVQALVAQSQKRSAVYDILTNPTSVTVSVS